MPLDSLPSRETMEAKLTDAGGVDLISRLALELAVVSKSQGLMVRPGRPPKGSVAGLWRCQGDPGQERSLRLQAGCWRSWWNLMGLFNFNPLSPGE